MDFQPTVSQYVQVWCMRRLSRLPMLAAIQQVQKTSNTGINRYKLRPESVWIPTFLYGRGIRIRTLNDGARGSQCFIQNVHLKHVSRLSYLSNVSVNFVSFLNTKLYQIIQSYLLDILMLGWSIVLRFIFLIFFLIAIDC